MCSPEDINTFIRGVHSGRHTGLPLRFLFADIYEIILFR